MTRKENRGNMAAMISNLGWPILLGGAMCGVFLALLYQGPLNTPLMLRYFAGHPINLCTTVLFFIGLAALLFKFAEVATQYSALSSIDLPPAPAEGQSVEQVGGLLDYLASLSAGVRGSYLGRRFNDLLESVERKGSAVGLDDEIKYLADMDAARQQDSYALVKIVIWAAPMLGFLGTVVGITDALGDLGQQFANNKEAANDIAHAMNGLLAGLYVAFDTTAQALLLSMVLMFIQFLSDRMESQVLSTVDSIVGEEMTGRFQDLGGGNDPHIAILHKMTEHLVKTSETLVEKQASLWRKSFDASEQQWSHAMQAAGQELQQSLAAALEQSLRTHAETLLKVENATTANHAARWEKWTSALVASAEALHAQQAELARQGAFMAQAVKATGDVIQLEQALNSNLAALAGSKHFEETAVSLAAAVNLLSTRLGRNEAPPRVELLDAKSKGRAA